MDRIAQQLADLIIAANLPTQTVAKTCDPATVVYVVERMRAADPATVRAAEVVEQVAAAERTERRGSRDRRTLAGKYGSAVPVEAARLN